MLQTDIPIPHEIQYIWDQPELQLLRVGPDLYCLKMPDNLSQYRGTVGFPNSRSIVNRSKFNNFIILNYRNNNNVACSLISVNKILLFVSLFSVFFILKDNVSKNSRQFLVSTLFSSTTFLIPFVLLFSLLVSLNGDVEVNPRPNFKPNKAVSICRWNLNSVSGHNLAKLHLLKAYVTVHKFEIICLSETYLDFSIPFDGNN